MRSLKYIKIMLSKFFKWLRVFIYVVLLGGVIGCSIMIISQSRDIEVNETQEVKLDSISINNKNKKDGEL